MSMHIQIIPPYPVLRAYISQIFVFECGGKLATNDLKLIVPNARIKLVIPFRNGITGYLNGQLHTSCEAKATLIGIADQPAEVDILDDAPAGNITVEFSPQGAYRFFDLRWGEIKNQIHPASAIFGKQFAILEERLVNTPKSKEKITLVQQFLVDLLLRRDADPVFDYCIRQVSASKG